MPRGKVLTFLGLMVGCAGIIRKHPNPVNKGPEKHPENPQEVTINRLLEDFLKRFDFYKNNPDAYMAFEDTVTTFTDEGDRARQAKELLQAALKTTEARLRRLKILLASGFFKLTQAGQKAAFDGCLTRLTDDKLNQNPFRISGEDGEETLLFDELELVIQTFKSIANRTSKSASEPLAHVDDAVGSAILELNSTFGLNTLPPTALDADEEGPTEPEIRIEDTLNPLGLDGEETSFPPEATATELPAGVADTTSIITAAPTPTRAELRALHEKAKTRFFTISREVGNIEKAIAKLGWWQLLLEKNRKEKARLQAELKAKIAEKEMAKAEVKRAKAAVDSHTDAKSTVTVATVATEVATQLPEPTGGFATMAADISQRIAEEKARMEAQVAAAKAKAAQAEKDRQALIKARTQKVKALTKAKADLAKMSGVTGFFRSMFNWGEKARLEAKVARLTSEINQIESQLKELEASETANQQSKEAPAKPEYTPGFLEWFRTSTAAKVSAALVAGSLLGAAFSMKNGAHSTDSNQAPIATSLTPETNILELPTKQVAPTASSSEKTSFTPEPGNTIWDAAHAAGLTGAELAQTTNDIVTQAYADSGSSLGEHLHSQADFQKVVKQMTGWGGYTKVLESAQGQTNIADFLNAVKQAHGEKVADLVEATIASTFDPMDAPFAPSMIKAALGTQAN